MTISEELSRLADLLREGHLTEEEFAEAKRQVLFEGNSEAKTQLNYQNEEMAESFSQIEEKVYYSSRWTSGNIFYPDAIVLVRDGIVFRKGCVFGSTEEQINYKAVASFSHNERHILFYDIDRDFWWEPTNRGKWPLEIRS